jgi:hypothetical protein
VPLWLVSFVEGTRITPAKLERSQNYAEATGLEPPNHVLIPRTKGFVASVQALRQSLDAVYDVTIGYPDGVPTLWQYIKGHARVAHLHIRRYPIAELPTRAAGLAQWLIRQFGEKDRLLERFYATHSFLATDPVTGMGVPGTEDVTARFPRTRGGMEVVSGTEDSRTGIAGSRHQPATVKAEG